DVGEKPLASDFGESAGDRGVCGWRVGQRARRDIDGYDAKRNVKNVSRVNFAWHVRIIPMVAFSTSKLICCEEPAKLDEMRDVFRATKVSYDCRDESVSGIRNRLFSGRGRLFYGAGARNSRVRRLRKNVATGLPQRRRCH